MRGLENNGHFRLFALFVGPETASEAGFAVILLIFRRSLAIQNLIPQRLQRAATGGLGGGIPGNEHDGVVVWLKLEGSEGKGSLINA